MITLNIHDETRPAVLLAAAQLLTAMAGECSAMFNIEELDEADAIARKDTEAILPAAAEVFGASGKEQSALSIVDAGASQTAQEDTKAASLIPPPPPVSSQNAASVQNADIPVAPPTEHPAAGVELDKRGLPWDSRIHASTKTKMANGDWKKKRGISLEEEKRVELELAALMGLPSVHVQVAPPPAPATVIPSPPAATATNVSPSNPFAELVGMIAAEVAAKRLNQQQVANVLNNLGIASLPLLANRPDMIPNVKTAIEVQIAANVETGVPV